jgi:hypothetical protein
MGTRLVELFANLVVERRNMINDYLRGRACIESVRGELISVGVLVLSISSSFRDFAVFRVFCWLCGFPSSR